MVLQLLAATEKTGELEVRGDDEEQRGFLGVSQGRLVSARYEDEDGYLALGAVFAVDRGDFEFLPQDRVDREDLSGDLEALLGRATVERERILGIREVVPHERVRFRLSERATERGEITLAATQWRALLLIDGERDVAALAERLSMPRLDAQQLLAALVRAGLIDPITPPAGAAAEEAPRAYRRLPPMPPIPPTQAGEQVALLGRLADFPLETILQLLAETKKTGRLEVRSERDTSTLGVSEGLLVSAVSGEEDGELGLGLAFTAPEGEFDFVPMAEAPAANLSGALDPLLDRAAGIRDRIVAIRGLIPNERARFRLSERATENPEIVLAPEQWRVLLGANGERDVVAIAERLRMRRLPVMMVLADLARGGYVDVIPATELTWPEVERRKMPWPTPAVATPPLGPPSEPEVAAAEPAAAAAPEPAAEDRLAALTGLFGPAEAPSPEAEAAAATAEALATAPPPTGEPEAPVAWEAPPAEPAPPPWEAPPAETAAPAREAAPSEAPAPAEPAEVDPRLAVFGAPTAEPAAPAWEAPAPEAPPWETPAPPAWETAAPEAPVAEPPAAAEVEVVAPPEIAPAVEIAAPPIVAPAPSPEKKKGFLAVFFGELFGGRAKPAGVAVAPALAGTRPGQLARFANELVAAYNSGQYGKGRVEGRMLSLIMRADEQADPIDRPLPITNDRLDVGTIDRDPPPERQALPYLAVLVHQIYDEAERALGKDKARRGFRDVRRRLFGTDLALLHAPEVSGRMPKI